MIYPSRRRRRAAVTVIGVTLGLALGAAIALPFTLRGSITDTVHHIVPSGPPPSTAALPNTSDPHIWASWALAHTDSGVIEVAGDPGISRTEGVIAVGIAAELLASLDAAGHTPDDEQREQLVAMLRDGDPAATDALYHAAGGDSAIEHLIRTCELRSATVLPGSWAGTQMSAADVAQLGACLMVGQVCSPAWMAWVLDQMRDVPAAGRWGIVEAHPFDWGERLPFVNGTEQADGNWHVSCLGFGAWWTLSVMVTYPDMLGLRYGQAVCANVAAVLLGPGNDETPQAPPTSAGPGAITAAGARG